MHWPALPRGQYGSGKRRADQPIGAKERPFPSSASIHPSRYLLHAEMLQCKVDEPLTPIGHEKRNIQNISIKFEILQRIPHTKWEILTAQALDRF